MRAATSLFEPGRLGRLRLPNRLVVAPMTRVSATAEGLATEQMAAYYAGFAAGGFGLVITEGCYTDRAHAQGYLHQPGLTDAPQAAAWRRVVERVHGAGGRIVLQLMHAGALSQGNRFRDESIGPSAMRPKGQQLAFYRGSGPFPLPRAATLAEIESIIEGFAATAALAREVGFDGVEVHGANGYLLDQFLTETTNRREDGYGGPVESRVRLIAETTAAVRARVGQDFLVGVRVSQGKVNDFEHRWAGAEADAAVVFRAVAEAGADYVHTTEFRAWQPAFGSGPSLAALAGRHAGLPVVANGSLDEEGRAAALLEEGGADFVALGRAALAAPDWPDRLRRGLAPRPFDPQMLRPIADLDRAEAWRHEWAAARTA
ncbi:NADH:flavin oxidoreductase [Vulgatibacter sp.]|uniref:NADH:flavin oxidoreductase n=1 Tax=Vulgatibacter sp. TaxID=1971226 RepID=UPI003564831F